jgi:hypothetical protein
MEDEFYEAAVIAKGEFIAMQEAMTPDEKKVLAKVTSWWKKNYMNAGHRNLARILIGTDKLPYEVKSNADKTS